MALNSTKIESLDDLLKYVEHGLNTQDPTVIGILVAVVVGVLTFLLLVLCGGSNKRRGVLICGLCDSGKTLLFSRLVNKTYTTTHTSIKENSGPYTAKNGKSLNMIDLPGHERVRGVFLDQFKSRARALIFVVDSLTLQKELKDVGDFLYMLLTDRVISSNLPPILIACNKQDATLAKGQKVIQGNLEKEINLIRVTQSAALQGTDNTSNNNTFLGRRNKDFQFADIKPMRVDFAECSAQGKSPESDGDLAAVEQWLESVA